MGTLNFLNFAAPEAKKKGPGAAAGPFFSDRTPDQ
jgi:hypothetical protein